MHTEADRKLDEARKSVQAAVLALSAIVVEQCNGYFSLSAVERLRLERTLADLLAARRSLG